MLQTIYSSHDDEATQILHYSLSGLLSAQRSLALNTSLGTLALLSNEHDSPRLIGEQLFTPMELSLLIPLLDSFPYYCPYEVLHASSTGRVGHLNEATIARSRRRLQEAASAGLWDMEMRPVRSALSRTRLKLHGLHDLHLTITSLVEMGYLITPTQHSFKHPF